MMLYRIIKKEYYGFKPLYYIQSKNTSFLFGWDWITDKDLVYDNLTDAKRYLKSISIKPKITIIEDD